MNKIYTKFTMYVIVSAVILLCISGCSDRYEERMFPVMPKELADCRVFYVENNSGEHFTAMRCPNSNTSVTTRSGKTTEAVVVIDGVEYAPVE